MTQKQFLPLFYLTTIRQPNNNNNNNVYTTKIRLLTSKEKTHVWESSVILPHYPLPTLTLLPGMTCIYKLFLIIYENYFVIHVNSFVHVIHHRSFGFKKHIYRTNSFYRKRMCVFFLIVIEICITYIPYSDVIYFVF